MGSRARAAVLLCCILVGCPDPEPSSSAKRKAPAPDAPSVRGVLRVSAFGPTRRPVVSPLVHRTTWVNGVGYRGMEDNDLRGFLDGRFIYGWNQPTQSHVRVGRRHGSPRWGEPELFRFIQRWDGMTLPADVRVRSARLELAVEKGSGRPLRLLLYAVKKDWDPGVGGENRDNTSPPNPGEVWWGERAHDREAWGLPGLGFASDTHPDADTGAMPLAETVWSPGEARVGFASAALAAYAQRRARAGRPLLFLVKLSDVLEDAPPARLWFWSGNLGDDRSPSRRPRLTLEWESPSEVARWERPVHLEHGRLVLLEDLDVEGADLLAASFAPDDGFAAPWLHLRAPGGDWRRAALPAPAPGPRVDLRLWAVRDPVVLGDAFRGALADTWIRTAPPEEQRVEWRFVAPSGAEHEVAAEYAGDYRWEVAFRPDELGRWEYRYRHDFDKPYESETGVFDVVAGDRENVLEQMGVLLERIGAAHPEGGEAAVAEFGPEVWRLERAALARETPESFRSEAGREMYDLVTRLKAALHGKRVPDAARLTPMERDY